MEEKIVLVLNEMSEYLTIPQMKKLQEVIIKNFAENEVEKTNISNDEFLKMFLAAKQIEGCSERTISYYQTTVEHLLSQTNTNVRKITTEEMRDYLANYQKRNNCSNVTVDNVRRNISSFFSWLEEEDYILKSPMKRIHKIKTKTVVKNTISDEGIEKLRDNCKEKRDLAIIDLLYSTGIRVGELVNLNIDDIDLEGRECVVYGKGDKERRVYFDAKAKVHLKEYIAERHDNNKARFVEMFGDIILNDKGWKTDTWSNALKIVNGKNQKAVESDDGEYLICGSGGAMGRATEYLTNENSVIIGRKGSINKPLLMREKYWNVDTAFGIEPNRKYINVDYLYMFCVFFNFEQLNKAVTIPSLTKADLLNIEMPIPNILLQEQFADFVHQVDKSKFMKSF